MTGVIGLWWAHSRFSVCDGYFLPVVGDIAHCECGKQPKHQGKRCCCCQGSGSPGIKFLVILHLEVWPESHWPGFALR